MNHILRNNNTRINLDHSPSPKKLPEKKQGKAISGIDYELDLSVDAGNKSNAGDIGDTVPHLKAVLR